MKNKQVYGRSRDWRKQLVEELQRTDMDNDFVRVFAVVKGIPTYLIGKLNKVNTKSVYIKGEYHIFRVGLNEIAYYAKSEEYPEKLVELR